MAQRIFIPPVKGAPKARSQAAPEPIDPGTLMNCMQFIATLKHTKEEIYTILVRNACKGVNCTFGEWRAKLQELKDAPA